MRPCRVLYVAKTAKGGSAFSLYHLVKELDHRLYEPIVLFYAQGRTYIGDKLVESGVKTVALEGHHQVVAPVSAGPIKRRDIARWLDVRLGRWASQVYVFLKACYQFIGREIPKISPIVCAVRQNKIDLVHVNTGLRHGKPGIVAAWLTGVPCICHVRMFDELNNFDKIFSRFVDSFLYISQAVAENYVTQGIPPDKGTVIHNAIDLGEFSVDFDVASVRKEFGWTTQERLVGVIGRLDWWKGHEYFLEAIAEVVRQIPNIKGVIVGEPENTPVNRAYYQKLQSLTRYLALEDKVVFVGFRSDVPRLMSAMDVIVLSSSTPEPFGRVVIEGMAASKPVVATAAGGVLDIIENEVSGLLVPCRDSKAMAVAVLDLLSDHEKAKRIGLAARQRVERKFTVQCHVAAIQQIYDAILGIPRNDRYVRREPQNVSPEASIRPLPGTEPNSYRGNKDVHTETCQVAPHCCRQN